jgi:hypothetical protein
VGFPWLLRLPRQLGSAMEFVVLVQFLHFVIFKVFKELQLSLLELMALHSGLEHSLWLFLALQLVLALQSFAWQQYSFAFLQGYLDQFHL